MNGSPGAAFWSDTASDVMTRLGGDLEGLSDAEVARRRAVHGPNRLTPSRHSGPIHRLVRQFSQPIALILIGATLLALLLGDTVDALIILVIILLSGLLGFWQEYGASVTVARLLARVQIHVEVRRGGTVVSVRPEDVVPGDVLVFNAGDIVPCDCRLLSEESLQVDESALTGESYPRHKHPDPAAADAPLAERHSALFQGSHVVSGKGEALAVVTGQHTELGLMAQTLLTAPARTSFEEGTTRFGLLLARVTAILTAAILVLNVTLGRPFIDAILFSLALAIGVTPQMLPAIVSVSLSTGARRLARADVIVRRLDAIEELGSMDVLCTDKTGTLTEGRITLDAALDSDGRPSELVAERAATNAGLQTGFTNPLDEAVLAARRPGAQWRALDEIPFDFARKRLSVLVDGPAGRLIVTKGAYTSVLEACSRVATPQGDRAAGDLRAALDERFERLSAEGYRVLAVAQRALPDRQELTGADEAELTFLGFLAFGDPVKKDLGETVEGLHRQGIRLCILTGDNRLTARHVAKAIGTESPTVLTGSDVDALDDAQLARAASTTHAFTELTPAHKERIIDAVRAGGSVVGYLGDGINDAGPLHRADVGISVDSAVDVAKSAASMVLLAKDLAVVGEGVRLGRRTFVNTLKYVYTTISANFGNTASMAAASAFLPFLPMLPRQILLLNFLSDLPSVTIAGDRVDEEEVERPRQWDVHAVRNFMITFGLLSSAFDLVAFAVLLQVFHADATAFRTGWFIESALTELAVLFVLRTRRV
ncbi:MAG TPA: magnesium-translocating P-type ATPase, partial [Dermatophilaceae bacterium]|nr:magnesium-translocating P-type ATPase [Dermatophilaceae bacterium]